MSLQQNYPSSKESPVIIKSVLPAKELENFETEWYDNLKNTISLRDRHARSF